MKVLQLIKHVIVTTAFATLIYFGWLSLNSYFCNEVMAPLQERHFWNCLAVTAMFMSYWVIEKLAETESKGKKKDDFIGIKWAIKHYKNILVWAGLIFAVSVVISGVIASFYNVAVSNEMVYRTGAVVLTLIAIVKLRTVKITA